MPKSVLFDINPDQLFEQKSIHEIDQVRIKIQHEIEKKREELRTMVGERYRDLIQAADTITEMKETSANVIEHIGAISAACEKSKENGFLKLQSVNSKSHRMHTNFSQNSIAAQINLLIITPENIWMCLENEDYLGAMQLYLFAQHISTGLQFRLNDDILLNDNSNWAELVQRQWHVISLFRDSIKNACYKALKSLDIKIETAVQCICSLSLPDETPMSNILMKFITLRVQALDEILHPNDEQYNVKTKVMESASLLTNTLLLVYECFIGSSKSLVSAELEKVLKADMLPVIKRITSESPIINRVLGDDILSFKPSVNMNDTISSDHLNKAMKLWMHEVETRVNKDLAELINLVNSIKSLQGIRHNLSNTEKPSNWQVICENLFVFDMNNLFTKYYQPLLTRRIQYLINLTWSKAVTCIKTDIEKIIANSQKNKTQKDIISWKHIENLAEEKKEKSKNGNVENKQRVFKKISFDSKADGNYDNMFTLINVYGFDGDMIKSCKMFDKCLKILIDDVHYYLYSDDGTIDDRTLLTKSELDENGKMILKHLNDSSSKSIKSLIDHIVEQYLNQNTCLILSRYVNAIMHLCPNLTKCFQEDSGSISIGNTEETGNIKNVFDEIVSLDMKFWQVWLDSTDSFIEDVVTKHMLKDLSPRVMLNVLAQWENVAIQEKDDERNETIDSNIRIPMHVSFPLQNILCLVNARIAQVGSHLMPDSIRKNLICNLCRKILQQYEVYASKEDGYVKTNQVAAVQLYFDVRYLQILTSSNARDEPGYQNVGDVLKGLIDPFDFDVFYPHLQRNIKRAVQKTQVQLGCLVGNAEQLNALLANTPNVANSKKQEIACVLPLVTSQSVNSGSATQSSYWFTLLPVTSIGNRTVEKTHHQQTNVRKVLPPSSTSVPSNSGGASTGASTSKQSQQKPSTVRSGAAAFFGSMGQDWFGTY